MFGHADDRKDPAMTHTSDAMISSTESGAAMRDGTFAAPVSTIR